MRGSRRHVLRALVALLSALAGVVASPEAAVAGGTYRYDDGTREAAVHVDASDGGDTATMYFNLPSYSVNGATSAKLWILARAADCDLTGAGHRLVAGGHTVDFDPCAIWSPAGYSWHAFDVPLSALRENGDNTLYVTDLDAPGPYGGATDVAPPLTGRNADYGVDLGGWYPSTIEQTDLSGSRRINGRLMWWFEMSGSVPYLRVWTDEIRFAVTAVGAPSAAKPLRISNGGQARLYPVVSVTGPDAADFSASGCASVQPGQGCDVAVVFTPRAGGVRTATAVVTAAGSPTYTVALSGEGATTQPPVTTYAAADGSVVAGTMSGSVAGPARVASESLRFDPETPGQPTVTTQARLDCDARGNVCDWTALVLLAPGRYTVTATATDAQGNVETPAPAITVIVV